jgi:hypothetical protein
VRTLGKSTDVGRSNRETERENQRNARSNGTFVEAHSSSPKLTIT